MWQKCMPQLLGLFLSTPHFAEQFWVSVCIWEQDSKVKAQDELNSNFFLAGLGYILLMHVISAATE